MQYGEWKDDSLSASVGGCHKVFIVRGFVSCGRWWRSGAIWHLIERGLELCGISWRSGVMWHLVEVRSHVARGEGVQSCGM